jgi:hypothetical protein
MLPTRRAALLKVKYEMVYRGMDREAAFQKFEATVPNPKNGSVQPPVEPTKQPVAPTK